jgi:hypothetical protein
MLSLMQVKTTIHGRRASSLVEPMATAALLGLVRVRVELVRELSASESLDYRNG